MGTAGRWHHRHTYSHGVSCRSSLVSSPASPVLLLRQANSTHSAHASVLDFDDIMTKGLSDQQQAAVRAKLAGSLPTGYRHVVLTNRSAASSTGSGLSFPQAR